jgi:hypothetical protein
MRRGGSLAQTGRVLLAVKVPGGGKDLQKVAGIDGRERRWREEREEE